MHIEATDSRCTIKIDAALDARELDKLITQLAEARAQMEPAVSKTRPEPKDLDTDTPVTLEEEPAIRAVRLRDGRCRLWLRHSGYGWMAFNIPMTDAHALRDWFTANLDAGTSHLFSQQHGKKH